MREVISRCNQVQSGAIRCNLPISPRSAYPLLNRGAMVQS